jgi:hypothetical protein
VEEGKGSGEEDVVTTYSSPCTSRTFAIWIQYCSQNAAPIQSKIWLHSLLEALGH